MKHVFWFTGMAGSGKTTLTKRIQEILREDFSTQIIDGDEIVTELGGHEFRRKYRNDFIKKTLKIIENSLKTNSIVLVAINTPKQEQRNYIREVLGETYHEFYLQCSKQVCFERSNRRRSKIHAKITRRVVRLFKVSLSLTTKLDSYEVPSSPNLIIDTERNDINESVQNCLNFINPKITKNF